LHGNILRIQRCELLVKRILLVDLESLRVPLFQLAERPDCGSYWSVVHSVGGHGLHLLVIESVDGLLIAQSGTRTGVLGGQDAWHHQRLASLVIRDHVYRQLRLVLLALARDLRQSVLGGLLELQFVLDLVELLLKGERVVFDARNEDHGLHVVDPDLELLNLFQFLLLLGICQGFLLGNTQDVTENVFLARVISV
jgi:hypothetical protein